MIAKTQADIENIREGGRRLSKHLTALSKLAKPGITGVELEAAACAMIAADGDEPAFKDYKYARDKNPMPSALNLNVNDTMVHGPASQYTQPLKEGDIVGLDLGIKHAGLFTDSARSIIIGKPRSDEERRLVDAVYEALEVGIAQARIGNTTGDIGFAIQAIAEKYGYGYPKYLSGHGVGRTVHEEPHVPNYGDRGAGTKLTEGLVIAIEPMFSLGGGEVTVDPGRDGHSYRTADGSRTAHAEHTVLITKHGVEVLTREY